MKATGQKEYSPNMIHQESQKASTTPLFQPQTSEELHQFKQDLGNMVGIKTKQPISPFRREISQLKEQGPQYLQENASLLTKKSTQQNREPSTNNSPKSLQQVQILRREPEQEEPLNISSTVSNTDNSSSTDGNKDFPQTFEKGNKIIGITKDCTNRVWMKHQRYNGDLGEMEDVPNSFRWLGKLTDCDKDGNPLYIYSVREAKNGKNKGRYYMAWYQVSSNSMIVGTFKW